MLMRAIPLLHGVFNYTIRKFSPALINEQSDIEQEKFRKLVVKGKVSKETEELMTYSSWHDESKYFMIGEDFSEIIIPIDDDNFEETEVYKLVTAINETRERFKATSDLKKCELPLRNKKNMMSIQQLLNQSIYFLKEVLHILHKSLIFGRKH